MSASNALLFTSLLVFAYLVTPTVLAWGWARLIKQPPQKWTISAVLSFVAFLLASASSLFALCVILYAEGGGFEHTHNAANYSPDFRFFYLCIRVGAALSLLSIGFSIGGVWQRSSLRWHAPASAIGTLAFWLLATTWP